MATITVEHLTKRFGDLLAVDDLSLNIKDGELLCLLGPSGCGKSTTLRMLAGLTKPTDGRVFFEEEDVTDLPPYYRDCSMVFQSWALFPYKTVLENVAFGLKMEGVGQSEREQRALEILEKLEIEEFAAQRPGSLSGGQQQRVALARSIVVDPDVLLLDEPLSNLDKRLREEMQLEIKNIHDDLTKTMVYVTHDQDEAFTLADRIGIMHNGQLAQIGEPWDVYNNPKNQFIEEFLGETNFVSSRVERIDGENIEVSTELGIPVSTLTNPGSVVEGQTLTVSIRPEIVAIEVEEPLDAEVKPNGGGRRLKATVENIIYRGSTVRYFLNVNDTMIFTDVTVSNMPDVSSGDSLGIRIDLDGCLFFNELGARVFIDG